MTDLDDLLAERLMTTREVAELCRVHSFTVIRWANRGVLSAIRTVGGHRRFRAADVQAVMGLDAPECDVDEDRADDQDQAETEEPDIADDTVRVPCTHDELTLSDRSVLRGAGRALDAATAALGDVAGRKVDPDNGAPSSLGFRVADLQDRAECLAADLAHVIHQYRGAPQ